MRRAVAVFAVVAVALAARAAAAEYWCVSGRRLGNTLAACQFSRVGCERTRQYMDDHAFQRITACHGQSFAWCFTYRGAESGGDVNCSATALQCNRERDILREQNARTDEYEGFTPCMRIPWRVMEHVLNTVTADAPETDAVDDPDAAPPAPLQEGRVVWAPGFGAEYVVRLSESATASFSRTGPQAVTVRVTSAGAAWRCDVRLVGANGTTITTSGGSFGSAGGDVPRAALRALALGGGFAVIVSCGDNLSMSAPAAAGLVRFLDDPSAAP